LFLLFLLFSGAHAAFLTRTSFDTTALPSKTRSVNFIALFVVFLVGFVGRGVVDEWFVVAPPRPPSTTSTLLPTQAPSSSPHVKIVQVESERRSYLLITACWGYARPWHLAVTMRMYGPSPMKIVCVADDETAAVANLEARATELDVEFVPLLRKGQQADQFEYACQRFERFAEYLRSDAARAHRFTHIMISDGRDVLVQGDPFARVENDTVLFSEEADVHINECRFNAWWVNEADKQVGRGHATLPGESEPYDGCKMLRKIGNETVSCSGVTLGTTDAILEYLDEMTRLTHIFGVPDFILDQGIHNIIVHHVWRNHPRRRVLDYLTSPVFTVGYGDIDDYDIDALGRLRHCHGMPAVVHQLDRHEKAWHEALWHIDNRLLAQPENLMQLSRDRIAAQTEKRSNSTCRKTRTQDAASLKTQYVRSVDESWCGNGPLGEQTGSRRTTLKEDARLFRKVGMKQCL
jgi:hypothetical protein